MGRPMVVVWCLACTFVALGGQFADGVSVRAGIDMAKSDRNKKGPSELLLQEDKHTATGASTDSGCGKTGCVLAQAEYTQRKAVQYYSHVLHTRHTNLTSQDKFVASVDVKHCLGKIGLSDSSDTKKGLAIIVSASSDRGSDPELEHAIDNMKEYAKIHGYTFYLQITDTSELFHFFSARWMQLVTSPIWNQHEWVLHLDGDSVFLNFNKSLDKYMSSPQHLILQLRLNKEVTAAVVLMRTTPFAKCFVRIWGGKGLHGRTNWDNGDLLSTLLDFAAPDLAGLCEDFREHGDYDGFVDCFSGAHTRLLKLSGFMPITILPPLAGFWKSLEGLHDAGFQQRSTEHFKLLMRCWSTDLIGHGSKTIGTWAWWTRQDRSSNAPNCLYNTPEEEVEVAKKCCLWHFSGCFIGNKNVCLEEPYCQGSSGTIMQCSTAA